MSNSHNNYKIDLALVREVYAGKTFPDIQLNTFQNIEDLFPCRTIRRSGDVKLLQYETKCIFNMNIVSDGEHYDIYDYRTWFCCMDDPNLQCRTRDYHKHLIDWNWMRGFRFNIFNDCCNIIFHCDSCKRKMIGKYNQCIYEILIFYDFIK